MLLISFIFLLLLFLNAVAFMLLLLFCFYHFFSFLQFSISAFNDQAHWRRWSASGISVQCSALL